MKADRNQRQAMLSWALMGVLAALAATLATLQYRWIGEVSLAEHDRLRAGLRTSLYRLGQDFNSEITAACAALIPSQAQVEERGREKAYEARYIRWLESGRHTGLFRRIGLAYSDKGEIRFLEVDRNSGIASPGQWPPEWSELRERYRGPRQPERPGQPTLFFVRPMVAPAVLEVPRFPRPPRQAPGTAAPTRPERVRPEIQSQPVRPEIEVLLLEVDAAYVWREILPGLLERHLGGARHDYEFEIVAADEPSMLIHASGAEARPAITGHADGSIRILEVLFEQLWRRFLRRAPGPQRAEGEPGRPEEVGGLPPGPPGGRGRWLLSVRHRAGSLEAVVTRARRRNLAVTTGILLLMLATIAALIQFRRRSDRLARLQMEFVTGVSHELRTPLSVIRTAAHNLGGGVVRDEKQVQRYGALIRDQAERLTEIVEQVLYFGNVHAGRTIGVRGPVSVAGLIEEALKNTSAVLDASRCTVEQRIEAGLPPVLADPVALRHAIQNLLFNAAKYGFDGGWIGISAKMAGNGGVPMVEILVADRGPGIPGEELAMLFDPFFRGSRALENQVHGTGLGLTLVKRIVEAHQGTVAVHSKLGAGAEFRIRIPAAPEEQIDEFADSPD